MKRLFAILLAVCCLTFVVGCDEAIVDRSSVFVIGEVTSVSEFGLMIEVTDSGDCGLSVGTLASVSLRGVSDDPSMYQVGDFVRVVFDGGVQESYPVGISTVYGITKI